MVIMTMMEVFLIMVLGYMIYDIKVRLTKGNLTLVMRQLGLRTM